MKLTITNVTPLQSKAVFLQWDLIPDTRNPSGTYTFMVQRSGSPEGPWDNISEPLINTVHWTDDFTEKDEDTPNLVAISREIYYRISVTDPHGVVAFSEAYDLNGVPLKDDKYLDIYNTTDIMYTNRPKYLLRRKLIYDETISLSKINGVPIYILKRKHFGERCTKCFDPLTKATTLSSCSECFGTSWIGGYYPGIKTWIRINCNPVQTSLTNTGLSDMLVESGTLLSYPKVNQGDIIVELRGDQRYYIQQVTDSALKRIEVHQEVLITRLPPSAPEYSVPIVAVYINGEHNESLHDRH